ncbi:hypothetical protein GCM10011408_40930 [Dyella caseinilytica]|nr:hypothetical protein GCM10011408_40930 [Dyella caseinilytica]
MRKVKELTITAVVSWALSPVLMASPPNVSDEQIIGGMQIAQLVPNTPTYDMWAQWIRRQIAHDAANYHDFRNGQFVPKTIHQDLDLITIRTDYHVTDAVNALPWHEHASSDETPVSLPVDGEPGEHITIISQTSETYLSWTYVWKKDTSSDRDGWQLTANAFHDCQHMTSRSADFRCHKPAASAM